MNILFFTPVNFRCRDVESLASSLKAERHDVKLLSYCSEGALHAMFRQMNMKTFAASRLKGSGIFALVKQIVHLILFCWRNRIDVVFSHLEPTNFVSVLAQYFIPAKIVIYRHHVDLAHLSNFDKSLAYRLTYRLAKHIIAVSAQGRQYMIDVEGVSPTKIHHINLGYDFSLYPMPEHWQVDEIKNKYRADIILVMVGRLDRFKRPEITLNVLDKLVNNFGIDAKAIFLGSGEVEEVKGLAELKNLSDRIFFPGYVENVLTYLAASDFLVHPSISESSSVAVKEAALVHLPVIVCQGVGDFDDYIKNEENGFCLSRDRFAEEAVEVMLKYFNRKDKLGNITKALKKEIISRFSISETIQRYNDLLYELSGKKEK